MAKTLAELINDAAANDDVEFTIPDGTKFKLGDVRLFKAGMTAEEKKLQAKQAEAERVAEEAKKLLTALDAAMKEEEKKNKGNAPPDKTGDWKKNPLYEDLVPVFEALTKQADEAKNIAASANKQLAQVSAFYTLERLRTEYNAAPESYRKVHTFEAVVQEAITSGDMESFGQGENVVKMPTLRKRIHEGTESDRIKVASDAAVTAAKLEWDKAQKLNSMPKPAGRFATRAKDDKPPITKLDELTSELVANDPDIAKAMEPVN